jgi:general secretion pathway protein G
MSSKSHYNKQQRRIRRAFTLLEIIVVVTIIALLATLVAPRLLTNIGRSKQKVAKLGVASIAQQLSIYCADNGMTRPPDDLDLAVLVPNYLKKTQDLIDPWDRPYILRVPPVVNPDFDVVSFGRDGQPGGDGEDADVCN